MKKYLFIILITMLFPQMANLQTAVREQITINFSPQFPRAQELVSVNIESYQTDLNQSTISWLVDGVLIEQGIGMKKFSFYTKDLGESIILTVRIKKNDGSSLERKYEIVPAEIDFYYEANTYVPHFYKGRPEFSHQSELKLVAIASFVDSNKRQIPNNQIVYNWSIDDVVDQSGSGVGKNVYYYTPKLVPRPTKITLNAYPINSQQKARTIKYFEPKDPIIRVYEKNPIYGVILEQTIKDNFVLTRKEVELIAIPYNFSSNILYSGIFNWKVNGRKVDEFDSNSVVFRKVDDGSSSNRVGVEVENRNSFMQFAEHLFNLNFSDDRGNFSF